MVYHITQTTNILYNLLIIFICISVSIYIYNITIIWILIPLVRKFDTKSSSIIISNDNEYKLFTILYYMLVNTLRGWSRGFVFIIYLIFGLTCANAVTNGERKERIFPRIFRSPIDCINLIENRKKKYEWSWEIHLYMGARPKLSAGPQ